MEGAAMGTYKFSTLKTIRAIAFIDLTVAVIFAVYRGICLSILLSKIPTKSDRDISLRSSNTAVFVGGNSSHPHNMKHDHSHNDESPNMKIMIPMLLTAVVMSFAAEVFLFLLLNSGAPMRNLRHCKHWFGLRVLLLCFGIAGSIIDQYLGEYTWISGVLEIEKIYRVVTLIIMWKFMDEIKAGDFDNSKLNFGTDIGSSNVFGSFSQAQ